MGEKEGILDNTSKDPVDIEPGHSHGRNPVTMEAGEPPDDLGRLVLEREFPSDEALVTPMVVRVMESLVKDGIVTEDHRNRVGLCLEEAIRNAVLHGNRQNFKQMVRILVYLDELKWSIRVDDEGEGFDLGSVPSPLGDDAVWGEGGRGLSLMAIYMDRISFYRDGRTLVMTRFL